MTQKLLAIIVLVTIASLSVAGCTTTNNANQAAGNTSQAASTTASTSASASASATPKAVSTAVPTAAPVVPTTPTTPTVAPVATPTPAIGTWSGSITVNNPGSWQFPQGSSVTLDIHITSGTSTGLAGQTVTLTSNGQQVATAVTNSNGDASATISTAGWTIGYHSIAASNLGIFFAATGFSVIAAK
jgi:hypothetical protein